MISGLLMLLGLVALLFGAELVVRNGSRLALALRVSPIVIGLTIVSLGTSAPELAVGIDSILVGSGDLAVGNIAGTNVVNLLLILGLAALIAPLALQRTTLRLDLPVLVGASVLTLLLALDGSFSRLDGLLLVLCGVAYTYVLVRGAKRDSTQAQAAEPDQPRLGRGPTIKALALLVAGIAIIVVGADLMVTGAVGLAQQLGVSDALIGLTVVAIGTSLPELVTTLVAAFRGNRDLAIGNLIGSSTYNLIFVLGASLLFASTPVALPPSLYLVGLPVMVAVALLCVPVFLTGRRVTRLEGGLLVLVYLGYLPFLLATS